MELTIISPEKSRSFKDVDKVFLPVVGGEVTVLNNHAPAIFAVHEGKISLEANGSVTEIESTGGIVEVKKNRVTVITENKVD